jgi:hypothetical protein
LRTGRDPAALIDVRDVDANCLGGVGSRIDRAPASGSMLFQQGGVAVGNVVAF